MKKAAVYLTDILITAAVFAACAVLCRVPETAIFIPAVLTAGAVIVSAGTKGFVYGIIEAAADICLIIFSGGLLSPAEKLVWSAEILVIAAVISILKAGWMRQKLINAEDKKAHIRAQMIRAVSHDLRTPLTTIYGSSYALMKNSEKFTQEQKHKMAEGIYSGAQQLLHMLENLFAVAKLDSGNANINITPAAIDELIDAVLVKFGTEYPGQTVLSDLPDEFVSVPMDALLIEQVLVNLLENAVRHAEGMTELSLKVFVKDGRVVFEVRDNGCGIAKDKMKTLFYADKADSGIGLLLCDAIVKAHNGDIAAESPKGGGTVVRFSLKAEDTDDE